MRDKQFASTTGESPMLTNLATWWLKQHGYRTIPMQFDGIVLGNCTVLGSRERMTVMMNNPRGEMHILNHSFVDFSEPEKAQAA